MIVVKELFLEMRLQLCEVFETLKQRIWQAIEANGEEAKLGKLLLKPFLKWEDPYHLSHAQVEGNVASIGEVAQSEKANLKPLLKEKTGENFWEQFVIEE